MIAHTKSGVALQAVVFLPEKAPVPRKIKLSECSLPLTTPLPKGFLTGFYGYQFKKEGLAAACAYARANHLQTLFIDYVATFDLPLIKTQVSLELLDKTEFVSTQRISRELCDEMSNYWQKWLKKDLAHFNPESFNWDAPQSFIGRHPEYVPKLLARPEWKHIRLLAHPAYVTFSDRPLILGTLDVRKATITSIQVRLRPDIEVVL
jgi:hypothetical protein